MNPSPSAVGVVHDDGGNAVPLELCREDRVVPVTWAIESGSVDTDNRRGREDHAGRGEGRRQGNGRIRTEK